MATSGLVSSSVLPSSRMAAISASSCAGSSVGGRVNNCGACTVAIAATISPMIVCPLYFFVDVFDAELFQLRPQAVEIHAQFAVLRRYARLLLLWRCVLAAISQLPRALSRGTTTTPSLSATITSPGFTTAPAQTTGTFTDPAVALTVPCAEMAFAQTGKFIAVRSAVSRTPASMIRPTTPCAWQRRRQQIAEHAVGRFRSCRHHQHVAALRTFPSRHESSDCRPAGTKP